MTKESDIVAREGFAMMAISLVVTVVLYFVHPIAGALSTVWFLFCVYFFRNPKRSSPQEAGKLIAPADGKVIFLWGRPKRSIFVKNP